MCFNTLMKRKFYFIKERWHKNPLIDKTCCFTGHRKLPSNQFQTIESELTQEVKRLINQGITCFMAGGAIGFDTIAAQAILSLKKEYKQIKLVLVIPCKDQANKWSYEDKVIYENIKDRSDEIVYLSDNYTDS